MEQHVALRLLAYLFVHCASNSSSGVRYFSSLSAKICVFLCLDLLSSLYAIPLTQESDSFIIVALPGHGNCMVLVTLKFIYNRIRAFVIVAAVY